MYFPPIRAIICAVPRVNQLQLQLLVLAFALMVAGAAWAQAPQPGLANDFEIDGNLLANSPGGIVGLGNDWLDGPVGPGTNVLFPDGTPINPTTTLHIFDLIKNADLDIFASRNKVFDDPNTYEWKKGSVPQKDDIQNGLVHFSTDEFGDQWIVLAGDRRDVSGDSYIDFEFLQNTLVMDDDGGFTSSGPHGGRTLGDILLTIRLENGGAQAEFSAQQWKSDGNGGYTYIDIPFPSGSAFVAANIDSQVITTYDAFGSTVYEINQLGEAAVNLSSLLPSFGDCFGIATMFIRTKSSTSPDAELKDFIEPIQLNKCLDVQPPVLTCPADVTVSCDESLDPNAIGMAFASDECTADPVVSYVDSIVSGTCPSNYTIHRIWTTTDDCGNVARGVQIITVVDNEPPTITENPEPITVQCTEDVPDPDPGIISATDNCGDVIVTHVSDISNGDVCSMVITRTYLVDDGCGNTAQVVQLITVEDTTPPEVTALSPISVQCGSDVPEPDIGIVSASDNCSDVTVEHVRDTSDGNSCPERITRVYRVTDACGNAAEVSQVITIDDTTAPLIFGPMDMRVACRNGIPVPDTDLITASDNCGNVTVSYVGDVSDYNSCPETITRTYRAIDDCGNASDWIQTITVQDTIPPVVEPLASIEVECKSEVPNVDTGILTASDNCGDVAVSHVGDVSDNNSCPETITRTYRVTDNCGNATDVTQIITIHDMTDPEITAPENVTVQCIDNVPPPDVNSVMASDNCGQVTVEYVDDFSDLRSCPEVITRLYRAIDACGNIAECTQLITVNDTIPPTVTRRPASVTVSCVEQVPPPTPGLIWAMDNCSDVTVTHVSDASDGNMCPEVITRTYRVLDECGNSTDVVQLITINDDVPPQLSACGADKTLECPPFVTFDPPTATDNCDLNPTVIVVASDSTIGPWTYTVTRTWQAFDQCDNSSGTCSQTIMAHCEDTGLCTVTQGFYGNYGGYFNDIPTIEIIRSLLGEPLVVGMEGRSLKINRNAADCVVQRLPGGTTPTTLPPIGNATMSHSNCQTSPPLPVDSEGKFENVLLSQTITLTLNTRLSFWLSFMPLQEKFCTQPALPGPDGLYNTDDDIVDETAPITEYNIPAAVLSALDNLGLPRLVAGLLELANRGLASLPTGGALLSEINNGVDAINRGFDRGRFLVDCTGSKSADTQISASSVNTVAQTPSTENFPTKFGLAQNRPNPFNPTTHITLALPLATNWSLIIYNVAGQLVKRFGGVTGGPAFETVVWNGTDSNGLPVSSGVYLYRLSAGDFVEVKKMVLLK